MPVREVFTLESAYDGLGLSVLMVRPEGEIRALVQLAHGMCEHKERYLPMMEYLAERGCLCVINDHRGHGMSLRSVDDLGYFYEGGDKALVEDLHQISCWMKERWPGLPLTLFGHSMGSLAVRAYCEKYDGEIDALIVCGSPGANPATCPGLLLVHVLGRLQGWHYRSGLIKNMAMGSMAKKFAQPEHPCAWVSANMENVIAYEADPLCNFNFTLNGYRALLRLMRRAYALKPPRANAGMPVRFLSGEDDPCAPDRKGFENAMERMRRAGFEDVQGKMYPGLRHEIMHEKCAEMIFEDVFSAVKMKK